MAERRPGALDGVWLGLLLAALVWLLRPGTLHPDTLAVLGHDVAGGMPAAAATPLAAVLRSFVAWATELGWHVHAAAHALVAAAAAAAIVCVHAAARELGLTRGRAAVVAGFVALAPAAVVAAASIHVHSAVLALASLATWLAVAAARRASWPFTLALGGVLAVVHLAAPIGIVVPLVALPLLVLTALEPGGAGLRRGVALAATAFGLALAVVAVVRAGRVLQGLPTFTELRAYDLGTLVPLLLRDAGRSFLPLALVVVAALLSPVWHRHALALVAAAGAAVLAGCHLTAGLGDDGSFVLPVLPAAALLAARWLSLRLALVLVLASAALAGTKLTLRAQWHDAARFADGVRAVAAGRPCWIVTAPGTDDGFVLAELPNAHAVRVVALARHGAPRPPADVVADLHAHARAGGCVLLTAAADAALRDVLFRLHQPHAPLLLRELETRFRAELRDDRGFRRPELVQR